MHSNVMFGPTAFTDQVKVEVDDLQLKRITRLIITIPTYLIIQPD